MPAPLGPTQSKSYWFTYDAENRIKINNGALRDGAIVLNQANENAYALNYDAAGNVVARVSLQPDPTVDPSTGLLQTMIERSTYDLRGNRTEEFYEQTIRGGQMVSNEGLRKSMTYDANNRLTDSKSYYGVSAQFVHRNRPGEHDEVYAIYNIGGWLSGAEEYRYDADGRLLYQRTSTRPEGSMDWVIIAATDDANSAQSRDVTKLIWQSHTDYRRADTDTVATGYDAAGRLITYRVLGTAPDGNVYTHTYTNTYQGWDGYQLASTSGSSSHSSFKPTTNTLTYDALGRLTSQRENTTLKGGSIDDRMRYYAYNGDGAVMQRREGKINSSGQFVQDFDKEPDSAGTTRLIHAGGTQQAELRQANRYKTYNGSYVYNNQLQSLNGLGGYEAGDASKVMPLAGENLRGLAQRVYGSQSMWYLIADANGLSDPAQELVPGLGLVVPKAMVSRNDASTFKPYNPAEAIGSTSPELPYIAPPPKNGCGNFAIVLMVVVAIAVSVATWGAMTAPTTSALAAATSATATSVTTLGTLGTATAATATAALAPSLGTAIVAGATAAAAGSLAGQFVGSVAGITSFSLRNVVSAGVSGGLTAGLGSLMGVGSVQSALAQSPLKAAGMALGRAAASYIGQKVAGIDQGFSWRAIAADAVSQYGAAAISAGIGLKAPNLFGGTGSITDDFAGEMIGGVVSLHTRRAFGFKDDIDYKRMALDAFGNALGNAVGRGFFMPRRESEAAPKKSMGSTTSGATTQSLSWQIGPSVVLPDNISESNRKSVIGDSQNLISLDPDLGPVDKEYRPVLVTAVKADDLKIDPADLQAMFARDVATMSRATNSSFSHQATMDVGLLDGWRNLATLIYGDRAAAPFDFVQSFPVGVRDGWDKFVGKAQSVLSFGEEQVNAYLNFDFPKTIPGKALVFAAEEGLRQKLGMQPMLNSAIKSAYNYAANIGTGSAAATAVQATKDWLENTSAAERGYDVGHVTGEYGPEAALSALGGEALQARHLAGAIGRTIDIADDVKAYASKRSRKIKSFTDDIRRVSVQLPEERLGNKASTGKPGLFATNGGRGLAKIRLDDSLSEADRIFAKASGRTIAENPVASRSYARLQEQGTDVVYINDPDFGSSGLWDPHRNSVTINLAENLSPAEITSTLIHESSHQTRFFRGFTTQTQYEEYLSFRREALFNLKRRPTLIERQGIWDAIGRTPAYQGLPTGKIPVTSWEH